MGTRSNIGYINEDGSVLMKYCHWDGYLSHNGKILFQHYQDLSKIKELVALGDMSSLAEEIGHKHPFDSHHNDTSTKNWCCFYGRDRGEEDIEPRSYSSKEEAMKHMEEYLYLYNIATSRWIVSNHGREFQDLEEAIKEEENED